MSQVLVTYMYDFFFQEFFSTFSEPEKTFKTLELKGDVPEEAFITEIIDDMISYIEKR